MGQLARFWSYLVGKRSEVQEMDLKDVLMARAILDIHRHKTAKEVVALPLESLRPIHRLDRETAQAAVAARAATLAEHRDELMERGVLDQEALARHLPSVSWIKVVAAGDGSYLTFEGNGRLEAMRQVFSPGDRIRVEVELYHVRAPRTILRRLDRVRRLNGLIP